MTLVLAAAPNPLWFVSRGLGVATLVSLTGSVVVGVVAGAGVRSPGWPRFASAGLHRNVSLFTMVLLGVHVVTAILDPYARIAWRDAVLPFASIYRPLWVGMGALALDALLVLALSSALRRHIGYRTWRAIHWAAYASWPPAILHSLGTGTDVKAPWMAAIGAMCLVSVAAIVVWRVGVATIPSGVRGLLNAAVLSVALLVPTFTAAGPLRPGWARAAGTPADMLAGSKKPSLSPAARGALLVDPATGGHRVHATVVTDSAGAATVLATDVADPSVQLVIRAPRVAEPSPVLAVVHDGRLGCVAAVTTADLITARCGATLVRLRLEGPPWDSTGWLWVTPAP